MRQPRLCKYHHDLKHHAGWNLTRDHDTHAPTWTSTTGHSYTVTHHDHRPTTARTTITHDDEIQWSDHVLTETHWDDHYWPDIDEIHRTIAAQKTRPAETAKAKPPVEDEQCPF